MTWRKIVGGLTLILLAALSGCGDDDGNLPLYSTAVVAFSAVSTARLPARINGVNIAVVLPAGISVATDPGNPRQISAAALAAGSALDGIPPAGKLVMGSYSSAGRLVRIVTMGSSGFGPGEYARLTCAVNLWELWAGGWSTQLIAFSATGYDAETHSTVDLTGYLIPRFALK